MDATLKQANIWKSIKKFWIDSLPSDVETHFDKVVDTPNKDISRWISVFTEDLGPGVVSRMLMNVFMFAKEDYESDKVITLRDIIVDNLFPARIDLYDTSLDPWEKIGGMRIQIVYQSPIGTTMGGAKSCYIETLLKWASVWS